MAINCSPGSFSTTRERMVSRGDLKCYRWFFCKKKIDEDAIFKTTIKKR